MAEKTTRADVEHRVYASESAHIEPEDRLPGAWTQAEPYVASDDLAAAVNLALYLRRPLLIEGEPGTGKTRLAYAIAYQLGYPLYVYSVRSSSRANELLYTFDAVQRLYDIQEHSAYVQAKLLTKQQPASGSESPPYPLDDPEGNKSERLKQYVTLGPLGQAIQISQDFDRPSVVLIDEIDKADVDFANDLLLVLDRFHFVVNEVPGWKFDVLGEDTRDNRRHFLPLVIITSNREKELPAPFLRRCLFYYIAFPEPAELKTILTKHVTKGVTPLFQVCIDKFWQLRNDKRFKWRKAPGTSELIDWVYAVERAEQLNIIDSTELEARPLEKLPHLETLLKTQADRDALQAKEKAA